jgi:hypothetical protein
LAAPENAKLLEKFFMRINYGLSRTIHNNRLTALISSPYIKKSSTNFIKKSRDFFAEPSCNTVQ